MAMPPTPPAEEAAAEEKAEQIAEQVILILREFKITVTKDSVIFELSRTPGELTHREWRVVKSFVDNLIAELKPPRRR